MTVVADASAILALLLAEDGWQAVEDRMDGAVTSTVIMGEVYRRTGARDAGQVPALMTALGMRIEPLTLHHAWLQAQVPNHVTVDGRRRPLGWGDRVVAALGLHLDRPVLTSDVVLMKLGEPYRFAAFR